MINKFFDKVIYINMDRDKEKKENTQRKLKDMNIKASRFPGIDGSKLTKDELKNYTYYTRNFTPLSVIGCGASHIKIWKKIVKHKWKHTLIFEDDIEFKPNFNKIFNKVKDTIPENWDLIYFGATGGNNIDKDYNKINKFILGFLKLSGYRSNQYMKINDNLFSPELPVCLYGYGISYNCAKYLLKTIKEPYFHIDAIMNKHMKDINVFSIHPDIVYQNDSESANTIHQYPYLLNKLCKKVEVTNDIGLDYLISVKYFRIGQYNFTLTNIIYLLLGMLVKPYIDISSLIVIYIFLSMPDFYNEHSYYVKMNFIFILLGYIIKAK